MPIPTTTITGTVYDPAGVAAVGGTVAARLSRPGSVSNGTTFDRVAGEVSDSLANSGLCTLALVPNDQVVPSGSTYLVTFRAQLANGRWANWAEEWQVQTSATPIALVDVVRVDRTPVVGPNEVVDVSVVQDIVGGATTQAVAESAQLVADLAALGTPAASNGNAVSVQSLGSSTARTLAARFADVVNVRDFGAAGNDSSDDSAAILAAIDSVGNSGTVFFPPGSYYLGAGAKGITFGGRVRLQGAGRDRTILRYAGAGVAVHANDGTVSSYEHHGWSVADLTVSGADGGGTATAAYGLQFGSTTGAIKSAGGVVSRVSVDSFITAGIYVRVGQLLNFTDVRSHQHSGDAAQLVGDAIDNDHVVFRNCVFRSSLRGVYIEQVDKVTFDTCDFEGNDEEGLYVNRDLTAAKKIRHVTLSACWIEGNNKGVGRTGGYAQLRFDGGDGSNWIETVHLVRPTFHAAGAGNWHVYFGRGNFYVDHPYVTYGDAPDAAFKVFSSSLVQVRGRSNVANWVPAGGTNNLFSSLGAGNAASIWWEHHGRQGVSYPADYKYKVYASDGDGNWVYPITYGQGVLSFEGEASVSYEALATANVVISRKLTIRLSSATPTSIYGVSETGSGGAYQTGQVLTLVFDDANSSVETGGSVYSIHYFRLRGAAPFVSSSGASIQFIRLADGTWQELTRNA